MHRTSFRLLIALLFSALSSQSVLADGRPFVISSSSLPPAQPSTADAPAESSGEANLIERLKQMVVLDYLRSALGGRFQEYAPQVTLEFAEGYILDYKVNRKDAGGAPATAGGVPYLELSGHLDVEGLNRFIRLNETKARGSASLRPVFVISSEVPGLSYAPGNTGAVARQSTLGVTFFQNLGKVFRKFNTELGLVGDRSLLLTAPAEGPSQVADLKDYASIGGFNSVVWVHLLTCRSPGCGMKAEIHTYNLSQGRRLFVQSAPLKVSVSDLNDSAKVEAAVEPLIRDYATKFEESVSKGTLFSTSYRLVVKNVDQYRSYKKLKMALAKLEYLVQAVPKRVKANEAEFQVLSPLSGRELAQRLQSTAFQGFQLTASSADNSQVDMRYMSKN